MAGLAGCNGKKGLFVQNLDCKKAFDHVILSFSFLHICMYIWKFRSSLKKEACFETQYQYIFNHFLGFKKNFYQWQSLKCENFIFLIYL